MKGDASRSTIALHVVPAVLQWNSVVEAVERRAVNFRRAAIIESNAGHEENVAQESNEIAGRDGTIFNNAGDGAGRKLVFSVPRIDLIALRDCYIQAQTIVQELFAVFKIRFGRAPGGCIGV